MRLSSLVLAAILSFSLNGLAQHSSAGGSSSSGSSGGSSSHSSSSGGSSAGSSNSGGHSSGSSGSAGGHSSASSFARGASSASSRSPSELRSPRSNGASAMRATDNLKVGTSPSEKMNALPEKRTFVSHLLHPFRKSEVKLAQGDLRRRPPICSKGHCLCPGGSVAGKHGVCSVPQSNTQCGVGGYWNGGGCVDYSQFRVGNCASLEILLRQQAQRMGVAEDTRQASCSAGAPECGELTTSSANEAERYRVLQQQLAQCRRQQSYSGRYGYSFGYSAGLSPFALF